MKNSQPSRNQYQSLRIILKTIRRLKPIQYYGQVKRRFMGSLIRRYPYLFIKRFRRELPSIRQAFLAAFAREETRIVAFKIADQFSEFSHRAWLAHFERGKIRLLHRTEELSEDSCRWLEEAPQEGSNRLWKMTLSYLQFGPSIITGGTNAAVKHLRNLVHALHPIVCWRDPTAYRDTWSPYSVSQRIISLAAVLALDEALPQRRLDDETRFELVEHVILCARFLLNNLEYDLLVNHYWKNLVALAVVDTIAPQCFFERVWLERELLAALRRDFLADGGHVERTSHYHRLALMDLELLRYTAVGVENTAALVRTHAVAQSAAITMSHSNGDPFGLNDSWIETPLILPREKAARLRDSGYLGKTGYVKLTSESWSVAFDAGPLGPTYNPGHGHVDQLAVEAHFGGVPLIVDPGVPTYSTGIARDWCRSEVAHNAPTLSNHRKAVPWSSFRVASSVPAELLEASSALVGDSEVYYAVGRCSFVDNSESSVYRGALVTSNDELVIVDQWLLRDNKVQQDARLNFLFDTDWRVQTMSENSLSFEHQKNRTLLWTISGVSLPIITPTEYYPVFGKPRSATSVTLTAPAILQDHETRCFLHPVESHTGESRNHQLAEFLSTRININKGII